MPLCRNFIRNLYDAAQMSCEVAALPFQAHANYGTWSIDFAIGFFAIKRISTFIFRVKIYWTIKKGLKPVLLLHSPFFLPFFVGGKK